jgi:RHS repeat-associated protein
VGDYSFGFNGKDKESEFNSGAYDFGARIHDARLGRWMSVDPMYNIQVTNYGFVSNNPLLFLDEMGKVQRDPKGNIIFQPLKKTEERYIETAVGSSEQTVMAQVEVGYVFTDSGEPIIVYRVLKIMNDDGKYVSPKGENKKWKTNCYGTSVLDGEYYVPDASYMNLLKSEFKSKVSTDPTSKTPPILSKKYVDESAQPGDAILCGKQAGHIIRCVGTSENGTLIWESQFAGEVLERGSLSKVILSCPNALDFAPIDEKEVKKYTGDRANVETYLQSCILVTPKKVPDEVYNNENS